MTPEEREEHVDRFFERLPDQKEMAHQGVMKWYWGQDQTFITHEGVDIEIATMNKARALECILYIDRVAAASPCVPYDYRDKQLWKALKARATEVEV